MGIRKTHLAVKNGASYLEGAMALEVSLGYWPVCMQHVTLDCLFQRCLDAVESWRLVQEVITS